MWRRRGRGRSVAAPVTLLTQVLLALALLASACRSGGGEDDAATPAPTSDDRSAASPSRATAPAPGPSGPLTSGPRTAQTVFDGPPPTTAEVEARIATFLGSPDPNGAALLALEMAHHGDRRWVPYLVDLIKLIGEDASTARVLLALQTLTGELVLDDAVVAYVTFGSWMLRERPDPGPGYLTWKRALFARYDPAFAPLLATVHDPILMSELQWAKVEPGGLPALDRPRRQPISEATWAVPDELVFGVTVDGVAVAYPERVLARHEVANDVVAATAVTVTYCPLCHTARAFAPGGRRFAATGLARNAAKVLVDDGGSLWGPLDGVALAGPATGTALAPLDVEVRTWADWSAAHPDGEVLAIPTPEEVGGRRFDYLPGAAYAAYEAGSELAFPALPPPRAIRPKADVATLQRASGALAVDVGELARRGPTVLDGPGGPVLAAPAAEGGRFYAADGVPLGPVTVASAGTDGAVLPDGRRLAPLPTGRALWFSWYGEHPNTGWWPR